MAFQPIIDYQHHTIIAHEALVRGTNGESAGEILSRVTAANRYQFDQACRIKAIEKAAGLNMRSAVSINFLPNAVYHPEACLRTTIAAAQRFGLASSQIIFELTEGERVVDIPHLKRIIREYQKHGFRTAIDDFGAGYAGLNLLADLQPDIIKLDMALVRNIHVDRVRLAIVRGVLSVCRDLGIAVIGEGVETRAELETLYAEGVRLFQGFYVARPAFEALPPINREVFDPPHVAASVFAG